MMLPRFCIRAALAGSGGTVSVTPYFQHIYPGCNKPLPFKNQTPAVQKTSSVIHGRTQ